jgi:hypothetical protein
MPNHMSEARDESVEVIEISDPSELSAMKENSHLTQNTGKKRAQRQGRIEGFRQLGIDIANRIGNEEMMQQ